MAPYNISFAAVNKTNFNLGNYVNQTDYRQLYTQFFGMKAGAIAVSALNSSVTIRTANVEKTCYFTLNVEKQSCSEENKILRCCNAAKPDSRYQKLYTTLFLEYKEYKTKFNTTNCVLQKK